MSNPTPNATGGGRFDFDDGGAYIGDWQDGRAHGLGMCTGPRGQGEYAGQWVSGFESCGVYIWPSGNTYEGTWTKGKRHGEGIETKGRWTYRGEWTTGFKGRYGVREASNTCARYEGTWAAGVQDGCGVETYSDGGTYAGQWQQGTRHGYGVRQSVPYGLASRHGDHRALRESLTSVRSLDEPDSQVKESERKLDEGRSGFVLHGHSFHFGKAAARRRLTPGNRHRNWRRTFALKFRRPFSTGDIEGSPSLGAAESLQSASVASHTGETHSLMVSTTSELGGDSTAYNIIDPDITEIYRGEWRNDKRTGFGVCERSDGLRYEGEWYNNKRFGYGVTTFPDKSREEGKYRDNVLISTYRKSRFVPLRPGRLRERLDLVLREARRAAYMAMQKADVARQRQAQAREKVGSCEMVAKEARRLTEKARAVAARYEPNFRWKGHCKPEAAAVDTSKAANRKSIRKLKKQDSVMQDDYMPSAHPEYFTHSTSDTNFEAYGLRGTAQSFRSDFRCSHFDAESPRKDLSLPSSRDIVYVQSHPPPSVSHLHHPIQPQPPDLSSHRHLRDRSAARHSPVPNYHYDQYSSAPGNKRDSGLGRDSSLEESVPSSTGLGALGRWESDTPDSVEVGYSSADEDGVENSNDRGLTVIIEDGVRKVVPYDDDEGAPLTPKRRSDSADFGVPFRCASVLQNKDAGTAERKRDTSELGQLKKRRWTDAQAGAASAQGAGNLLDARSCASEFQDTSDHVRKLEEKPPYRPNNFLILFVLIAVAVAQHWIRSMRQFNMLQTVRWFKNWFVKNLVVLLVLAVNSVLAFLFFRLLNTNRS